MNKKSNAFTPLLTDQLTWPTGPSRDMSGLVDKLKPKVSKPSTSRPFKQGTLLEQHWDAPDRSMQVESFFQPLSGDGAPFPSRPAFDPSHSAVFTRELVF